MTTYGKFYEGRFLVPSFVYIIGVGGIIVLIQLLMIYLKTGKPVFSDEVDTATIVYTILTALILLFSVLIPLLAFSIRKKHPLVSIAAGKLFIREKALKKAKQFNIIDIASFKLFVSEDEKRSSMRIELKSGRIILLQLYYVLIASGPFKEFMKSYSNITVQDW